MFAFMLLLLASLFSLTAISADLLPHKATYTAKIKKGVSMKGEAVRELTQLENGQWLYRFDVDSFAADIKESTTFSWQNNQITPHDYSYKLSPFLASNRKRNVSFNWQQKTVRSTYKNKKWTLDAIPINSQDRLSYQLQMLVDVKSGRQDMIYPVVHKGKIKDSHFKTLREEPLETALGTFDSILVTKVRAETKKRKTLLWFAKDHSFLLLKMNQIEKDGDEYEINIKSAEINGITIKASN
jgi:hypothetical protein